MDEPPWGREILLGAADHAGIAAPLGDQILVAFISTRFELKLDALTSCSHHVSMNLEEAAAQLEALGSPTRLQVYRTLVRAGHSGMPVGRLQEKLGVPASTLSHHLHRLIQAGLVTQERRATTLISRANYPAMAALLGFMSDECCADSACGDGSCEAGAKEAAA